MYDYEIEVEDPNDPRKDPPKWSTCLINNAVFSEGITYIGKSALRYNHSVTSVSLPSTLEGIGQNAFSGTEITSITIPESVTSIGLLAFSNTSLVEVVIPDGVTSLGSSAFAKCTSLKRITIGAGVTEINQGLFANTPKLESVTLGPNVKSINRWLTSDCGLRSIDIPASVTWISPSAFSARSADALAAVNVDPANARYRSIDGVLYDKECTEIIRYLPAMEGTVFEVPEGVRYLSDNCFLFAGGLEGITLPEGLEYIGTESFTHCTSLRELVIPDSVSQIARNGISTGGTMDLLRIGEGIREITVITVPSMASVRVFAVGTSVERMDTAALQGNPVLEGVEVHPDNLHYASACGVLYNANMTQLLVAPRSATGSLTLPESVTHIADNAFSYSKLDYVTLDGSIQVLGNGAFRGAAIKTMVIPDTVKIIGNGAFEGCSELTFVYFVARNPPSIGSEAFSTGDDLRIYSPMAKGFADPYSSDPSLISYYESDVFYSDTADMIIHGQVYMVAIVLSAALLLLVGERLISRRISGN